ncbi:MAG: DUF1343 domain-containing protein [Flavobacteriales bacterium]|nr:DUF1343 domain-containing protein [Flavobacteriales bacterium]
MNLRHYINIIIISFLWISCSGQDIKTKQNNKVLNTEKYPPSYSQEGNEKSIIVGAERINKYLNLLKGKKVGVVANHTSMIKNTHLVDSLVNLGINVTKVFSPEHGFRGKADAGEKVNSNIDTKTGLPIISLYGKNKKPTVNQFNNLDIIIFDIQDVGARFYTYISTMHYVMETCAETNKKLIILDRPNPNGHYIDGPILEKEFNSFVGMHPVPIVHGMTIGEYAKMINGEGWLANNIKCDLIVIETENYDHNSFYQLPIKPSPNLPNMSSIYLYPSLCLFEGTPISVGRGTDKPFQVIGHPQLKSERFSFTPKSMAGSKKPKLKGEQCNGYDLSFFGTEYIKGKGEINLYWLTEIYKNFPKKEKFFTEMFQLLSGTDKLQQQIETGKTEEEIKTTWKEGLTSFRKKRKKYLLYKDFE